MPGPKLGRRPSRTRRAVPAIAFLASLAASGPARAGDDLWDRMMQSFNLKAAPAAPAADFVERSRPDAADLGYLPPATPHKVSAVPVKTPAQIQAQKSALDAAKERQLDPGGHPPAQLARESKRAKPKPGPVAAD